MNNREIKLYKDLYHTFDHDVAMSVFHVYLRNVCDPFLGAEDDIRGMLSEVISRDALIRDWGKTKRCYDYDKLEKSIIDMVNSDLEKRHKQSKNAMKRWHGEDKEEGV